MTRYLPFFITAITGFASALGFFIQAMLARRYGAGIDMDLYLLALSAPLFLASVVTAAYSYSIVPALVGLKSEHERILLNQTVLVLSSFICSLFILFSFFIEEYIGFYSTSHMIVAKKDEAMFALAWLLGGFQVMLSASSTILTAEKRYLHGLSLQLGPQIGLIIMLLVFNIQPIFYVMLGSLIGCLAALGLSIYFLRSYLTTILRIPMIMLVPNIKKLSYQALLGAVASSVFGVYVIIDAANAPSVGSGVLSSLSYAQRIVIGFGNIAVVGVFTIAAPQFKEVFVESGPAKLFEHVVKLLFVTFIFSLIVAVGLYFFTRNLLELFFQSNSFLAADVALVTTLVRTMLPGMSAMLLSAILVKAIFCLDKIGWVAVLFGLFWPLLYSSGLYFSGGNEAIDFSQSYTGSWIIFVIILFGYLALRLKNSV